MKVVVIGAGAAGFFGAITCAETNPGCEVILIEKSDKVLAKVKVSGGGRCNVTHYCFEPRQLVQHYPRGNKALLGPFNTFQPKDTVAWFESRGVQLKDENDGRIFPVTDDSQTIIDCLLQAASEAGVKVWRQTTVAGLDKVQDKFSLTLSSGQFLVCDKLLIATGGHPKEEGYTWLKELGHEIVPPVPSLFTFNVPDKALHLLAGVSVEKAKVRIEQSKLIQEGPLLITHWGFSGPAILKLSAWGARLLHDRLYNFAIHINWLPDLTEADVQDKIKDLRNHDARKQIHNYSPFHLPIRLWKYLVNRAGIGEELRWADLSLKSQNKLVEELIRCIFTINGKSTFKEEFVTCGGVSLNDINFKTMESKKCPGMFFAGEVLDIDGVTGGFNFQAAWTTGWIAGKNITYNS